MKLDLLCRTYQEYTEQLTANCHKLGFACGAIAWVLKPEGQRFPLALRWSLVLLVAYFFLDISQYFSAVLIRRTWTRRIEVELYQATGNLAGDVDVPVTLDRVPYVMWLAKVICLLAAYAWVAYHVTVTY